MEPNYPSPAQTGQLVVLNTDENGDKNKAWKLSNNNRNILLERGDEILAILSGNKSQPSGSSWSWTQQLPSTKRVGQWGGHAACQTYGSGAINSAIAKLFSSLFPQKPSSGLFGNYLSSAGANAATTAAQMLITPNVLPWLSLLGGAAGGVALPVALNLAGALYNRLVSSERCALESLPQADKLINYDSENQCYCDAAGVPFSEQDLKDIQKLTNEYILLNKLLECQSTDEMNEVIFNNLDAENCGRTPEQLAKDEKKITKEIDRLQNQNPTDNKGILKAIKLLAAHYIKKESDYSLIDQQKVGAIYNALDTISPALAIPAIDNEHKYGFDSNSGQLYVRNSTLASWWYGQTTAHVAEAMPKHIEELVEKQCDQIENQIAALGLNKLSEQDIEAIVDKITATVDQLSEFNLLLGNAEKGEQLQREFSPLQEKLSQRLLSIADKLPMQKN